MNTELEDLVDYIEAKRQRLRFELEILDRLMEQIGKARGDGWLQQGHRPHE